MSSVDKLPTLTLPARVTFVEVTTVSARIADPGLASLLSPGSAAFESIRVLRTKVKAFGEQRFVHCLGLVSATGRGCARLRSSAGWVWPASPASPTGSPPRASVPFPCAASSLGDSSFSRGERRRPSPSSCSPGTGWPAFSRRRASPSTSCCSTVLPSRPWRTRRHSRTSSTGSLSSCGPVMPRGMPSAARFPS